MTTTSEVLSDTLQTPVLLSEDEIEWSPEAVFGEIWGRA
jgi:hypothetical protein